MRKFNEKQCVQCGNIYTPLGSSSKFCSLDCRKENYAPKQRVWVQKSAIKSGRLKNPGVGKGGMIRSGKEHPSWKNGIGTYKKKGRKRLEEVSFKCERCDSDIDPNKKGTWATHHKDHDRTNNSDENLEILCKKCHQIEHECWKALSIKV